MTRELRLRIVSAAVMLPIVVADVLLGGYWFQVFALAIAVAIAWEYFKLVDGQAWTAGFFVVSIALVACWFEGYVVEAPWIVELAILVAALVVATGLAFARKGRPGWTIIAVPYVALPLISLITLRDSVELGLAAVLWIFCVVWATDIAAYFAGRTFGGPKLAPRASPNKTWSGLIGGMAGAALAGAVTTWILGMGSAAGLAAVSALLAVSAQAGDIFESAMKRTFGVKDSSNLIPGHGGVMDRVDGMVVAVTVACAIGVFRSGTDMAAQGILVW